MGMVSLIAIFLYNFRDMGTTTVIVQRPAINERLLSTLFWVNCALVLGFYSYTWRYRSQQLRRNVIDAVSSLIAEAHTLDGLTTTAVTLIQEIEVVARGYEMYVHFPGCFELDLSKLTAD